MPVLLDSSAANMLNMVAGTATSGSVSGTCIVNSMATNVVAIVAVNLVANVDSSGSTLAVTFGGVSMTPLGSPVTWDGKKNVLALFSLVGPPAGAQTIVASVSGLTGNASGFWLMAAGATYSGVVSIGSPVTVSGDSGAATANSVTVTSVAPAYRVVTAHAVRTPNLFSAYNQTTRARTTGSFAYTEYLLHILGYGFFPIGTGYGQEGELLLGDAAGAASVTGTATQPSTAQWGAIGVSLVPAPVVGIASLGLSTGMTSSAHIHRSQAPDPRRTWVIKT